MLESTEIQHEVIASSQPPSSRGRTSLTSDAYGLLKIHAPSVPPPIQSDGMKSKINESDVIPVTSVPGNGAVNLPTSFIGKNGLDRSEGMLSEQVGLGKTSVSKLKPQLPSILEKGGTRHMSVDHTDLDSEMNVDSKHVDAIDLTGTEPAVAHDDASETTEITDLVASSTISPISEILGTMEQLIGEHALVTDVGITSEEEITAMDTTFSPIPSSVQNLDYSLSDIIKHNDPDLDVHSLLGTTEITSGYGDEVASTTEEPLEEGNFETDWSVTNNTPESYITITGENSESLGRVTEKGDDGIVGFPSDDFLYSTTSVTDVEDFTSAADEILNTVAPVTQENVEESTNESISTTLQIDEKQTGITETMSSFTEKIPDFSEQTEEHEVEETTVEVSTTDTSEIVILEASMGVNHIVSEGPLKPTSFDVKIKTIKDLQVDAIFDPSQVAKATSYEESSYSTATRSATVTTWVDPNSKNLVSQGSANLTDLKEMVNSSQNLEVNLENIKVLTDYLSGSYNHDTDSGNKGFPVTQAPPMQDKSPYGNTYYEATASNKDAGSKEEKVSVTELNRSESGSKFLPTQLNPDPYEIDTPQIPVLKFNIGEYETVNGTRVYLTDSGKTGTQFIYEMPDMNRSSGPNLAPSVVIALSVCCSLIVLIGILTVSLWFCRRHKNRSKIYLSRDAARPRAFFTKPMNPALLPDETPDLSDPMYVMEFQKPRPPIVLSDDPDCIIIDGQTILKSEAEGYEMGIENKGFVDIPLEEIKSANFVSCSSTGSSDKACGRLPPKAVVKDDQVSDSDSGIKVWSSTGSLYTVSRELSHCSLPPPPYSSSIGEESINLSVDTFASLGSKSGLLYV